jgi:RNA-binding protein YhbY
VPLIEERLDCECVGTVGRMAILYREHPDPEKRKIRLP